MSGPRFVTATIQQLYAVRWSRFRLADLVAVRAEVASARIRARQELVYLSVVPASNRAFSQQEHAALGAYVKDLLTDCVSIHHVVDGEGFVASARRSIVTQLALASARPDAFFTHATLEEAAAVIAPRLRMSSFALLDEARAHDLALPA